MLTPVLILSAAASAAPIGSPQWPAEWGRLRVQTTFVGERLPTETQLKWRTAALRVDTSIHDGLGVWAEVEHTGGRIQPTEQIGGNAAGVGLRAATWIMAPIGFGLHAYGHYRESWTTGSAGGIKSRVRGMSVETTPALLVGDPTAQGWVGLTVGAANTSDLLVVDPSARWSRPGYRGWSLGAELRSSNLNGIGSQRPLRSFVGIEFKWAEYQSCSIWSGLAF